MRIENTDDIRREEPKKVASRLLADEEVCQQTGLREGKGVEITAGGAADLRA